MAITTKTIKTKISEIKGSIDFEEIEIRRHKILEILNDNDTDPDKYLILTNDLYRSKAVSRYFLILNLQIVLGCSEKQSREIAALFV